MKTMDRVQTVTYSANSEHHLSQNDEQCKQRTGRTAQISRTRNSANSSNCANNANN